MSEDQTALMKMLDELPIEELATISTDNFSPEEDGQRVPSFEGRFKVVKVKNDSQTFEVDDELVKELRGVIVEFHTTKTFYIESYEASGGGQRPDCYSNDSVTPKDDSGAKQSDRCSTCQRNKFYPDPDPKRANKKKKDCRDTITLYIWNPREERPLLLRVSTMNRKVVSAFIKRLSEKGIAKELISCEFSLFKDTETADVPFSGLTITPRGTILQMVPFFKMPENKEHALNWFSEQQIATLTPKMIVDRISQFKKDHEELFETEGAAAGAAAEAETYVKPEAAKQQEKPQTQPDIDYDVDDNEPPF